MSRSYKGGMSGIEGMANALDAQLQPEAQAGRFGVDGKEGSPGMGQTSSTALKGSAAGMAGYYHDDDPRRDTMMAYRLAAAGEGTGKTASFSELRSEVPELKNFKVQLGPEDIEFFEKRRKEQQAADFDAWVSRVVDMANPGESRWLQNIHPEFWARREAFIDDKINIEARMAKLRLRGVKTKEDLLFLYALDNQYITPSTQPLFNSSAHDPGSYRNGWLSLFGATKSNSGYGVNTSSRNQIFSAAPQAVSDYNNPATTPTKGRPRFV